MQVLTVLRAGIHRSRGDTLRIRTDGLLFVGQHLDERLSRYGDVTDVCVEEFLGKNPVWPGLPEAILLTFRFSNVLEFIGHVKRDPRVEDDHYLSTVMMFDVSRREEVRLAVMTIDDRRMATNRAMAEARFMVHDSGL